MERNTNLYAELDLNPEMPVEDINQRLVQIEKVWNQRILNEPEKANHFLIMINEAKEVFSSEETKKQYDLKLNNKEDESTDNNGVSETVLLYKKQVEEFIDKNQWDLANIALEMLLHYLGADKIPAELESKLYLLASEVYLKNKKYHQAIDCENRAIVCLPDCMEGYKHKTKTLETMVLEELRSSKDPAEKIEMLLSSGKSWVDLAKKAGDNEEVVAGLLVLAQASERGKQYLEAYQYSIEANRLDPEGHAADKILSGLSCNVSQTAYEFSDYYKEKSPFEKEINELITDLINKKHIPENGIKIIEKRAHIERECTGREENESILRTYYLKPDGSFVARKTVKEEEIYLPNSIGGRYEIYTSEPMISESNAGLNSIFYETDFDIYCERRFRNADWSCYEWNSIACEVSPLKFDSSEINRKGRLKGKNFFEFLRNYVEQNQSDVKNSEIKAEMSEGETDNTVLVQNKDEIKDESESNGTLFKVTDSFVDVTNTEEAKDSLEEISNPVYRINPSSIEDGRTIVDKLMNKITVEINLDGLDLANAQRIIDFVAGAVWSLDARLECVSSPFEFLATPCIENCEEQKVNLIPIDSVYSFEWKDLNNRPWNEETGAIEWHQDVKKIIFAALKEYGVHFADSDLQLDPALFSDKNNIYKYRGYMTIYPTYYCERFFDIYITDNNRFIVDLHTKEFLDVCTNSDFILKVFEEAVNISRARQDAVVIAGR